DLPKPFQAAVTVTKHLGVEYLWIDSFCIIQNSAEDWERECSRMASICTSALVTIAASGAIDSSKGFLHDYFPTKFGSFKLSCNNKDEHSVIPPPPLSNIPLGEDRTLPMDLIRACLPENGPCQTGYSLSALYHSGPGA
ncbi:hypothetical protein BGZ57DRAFT_752108, partial [Hyaloscypha finlandica]